MIAFKKFLVGDFGLSFSYWLITIPAFLILGLVGKVIGLVPAAPATIAWVAVYLILIVATTVALWNAAKKYTGRRIWVWIVKAQCALTVLSFAIPIGYVAVKSTSDTLVSINDSSRGNPIVENQRGIASVPAKKKTRVKFTAACAAMGEMYFVEEYSVDVDRQKVIYTLGVYNKGTDELNGQTILALARCDIIDENNWRCNERHLEYESVGKQTAVYKQVRSVVNGVFAFKDDPDVLASPRACLYSYTQLQ